MTRETDQIAQDYSAMLNSVNVIESVLDAKNKMPDTAPPSIDNPYSSRVIKGRIGMGRNMKSGGRAGLKSGGRAKGCGKALRGFGKAMKGKR